MTGAAWNAGAVAVGGACGALARYFIGVWYVRQHWYGLPAATLTANVLGCFLAGLVLVWLDTRGATAPFWRNLLMVGFLGGLTTFSALSVELWQYLKAGRYDLLLLVTAVSLLLGVAAVAGGYRLGKTLLA